jgi:multidrug efflux system membrane fusion protein
MKPSIPPRRSSRRAAAGCAGLLLAVALLPGCTGDPGARPAGGRGPVAFPVEVERATAREVEYAVTAVGSVDAFETVQVVSRVPGTVEKIRFAEGDDVDADETLVEIELERYRIEVDAARAALSRAEAEAADAASGLARRERGNENLPGLFPEEDVETYRTRVRVADAVVSERKAALARAELNLEAAYVRAPAAGRIDTRSVETGQYVQAGTVLATIVRRDPLLLRFDVPEPDAASLRPGMRATFRVPGDSAEHGADITHVSGAADPASRMVAVTARVVAGAGRESLRPGSFAEVRVPVGMSRGAPVIPQTAIRPSEHGFLAFVVEDGVARRRVLTLGLRTADGRVEVRDGLSPGEDLVVRGAEALEDGAAVRVEPAREPGP